MGFTIKNFEDNDDVEMSREYGPFRIVEYIRDLSCTPAEAQLKYYMSQMDVLKRQLLCDLNGGGITLSPGAMQWMVGDIQQTTGLKGVGDAVGKFIGGKVTGESAIKPEYKGHGIVVTEPSYRHLLPYDLTEWEDGMVVQDGLFYACESNIKLQVERIKSLSGAVAGGEGLFNLKMKGHGWCILESRVPAEELITIDLKNDTLKVDGSYAIAWSPSLRFTVERSGKTLLGSAVSGEGLVNVYSGTGRVIMMPQV